MRTTIAALAAALTTLALAGPASAFRPVPGRDYPDLCKNRGEYAMPGKQTVALFLPVARVRFVNPEQEPNRLGRRDCEVVKRRR
jgi:hypothetical protein